ncbi:MAG TPA: GON domain-containing protein [Symbiobacteriaceae bacterium]|nr:GON domain-containing protein [Symbiobacteriaceae bacterium]
MQSLRLIERVRRLLAPLSAALVLASLMIIPGFASAAALPTSCAEVKQQNPAATDGEYTLNLQGRSARIYCADMAGTPKEYVSLAHTGGNYNYSFYYGSHKNHYYQYWWVYGTNALTHYNKVRINPVTLVVDQNDQKFAVLTSVGKNGYDSSDPNFNPVPQSVAYGTGGDCAASWSALGKANVDLTGTDFALADETNFGWGGFAANGSVSVDPGRQIVNMTGGGWCGGVGPQGPLKLKLLTPLLPTDTTPPVTTASAPSGWQNQDVTVTFSATDSESGVAATYWQLDGAAQQQGASALVSTDGTHTLTFWSVDNQGNTENPHSVTVQVDKMAPVIGGSASTTAWTNQPVTVTFSCTDGPSGIQSCQGPVTLTAEGANQSATGTAVDLAGNTASATVSNINIDLTAPSTTASAPSGWQNADVTLAFSATDSLSGVKETWYSVGGAAAQAGSSLTLSADGTFAVQYWSVDNAGNTEAPHSVTVQVDKTAPVITGSASTTAWTNQPVTVSFTCTDATSGIQSCQAPVTLAAEGADQSATGTAVDNAGNTASATVSNINIDMTAPAVTYTGNAGTYTVDSQVSITCTASDNLSGVAASNCQSISGPAYTFNLGSNAFSASATDMAGNTSSATASFTVAVSYSSLCSLTQQFVTDGGLAQSLCAKLDAAKASADRQNLKSKAGQIGAYVKELQAQTGKALTPEQAAILTRLAQSL